MNLTLELSNNFTQSQSSSYILGDFDFCADYWEGWCLGVLPPKRLLTRVGLAPTKPPSSLA
jgi:hypothetical protein